MTEHPLHGEHGEHATMGLHGMLLFGEEALYLSHLPMFERPHNFQVLLEVGFDDVVLQALHADREAGGDLHTFKPEKFPISELDPSGDGPARTSMAGTVFHGHFERGGTPIASGTAQVRNVVYFDELDRQATHDPDATLRYLCFGRAGRLHLAHQITASPDFDQVLTARLVPGTVTNPMGEHVDAEAPGTSTAPSRWSSAGGATLPRTGWRPTRPPTGSSQRPSDSPAPTASARSWRPAGSCTSSWESSAPRSSAVRVTHRALAHSWVAHAIRDEGARRSSGVKSRVTGLRVDVGPEQQSKPALVGAGQPPT